MSEIVENRPMPGPFATLMVLSAAAVAAAITGGASYHFALEAADLANTSTDRWANGGLAVAVAVIGGVFVWESVQFARGKRTTDAE